MDVGNLHGKMEKAMKVNSKTIWDMAMGSSNGAMEDLMKVTGKTVSKMA